MFHGRCIQDSLLTIPDRQNDLCDTCPMCRSKLFEDGKLNGLSTKDVSPSKTGYSCDIAKLKEKEEDLDKRFVVQEKHASWLEGNLKKLIGAAKPDSKMIAVEEKALEAVLVRCREIAQKLGCLKVKLRELDDVKARAAVAEAKADAR